VRQDAEPVPRLFGTDGVRGVAGTYPLDRSTVRRLGAALVRALPRNDGPPRLLIGRDTRESGPWIAAEFATGAASQGAEAAMAGIVPTPAIAYLASSQGYDAGVVISASHNPFEDNGIKIFSGRGEKFTEQVEREVEAIVADARWSPPGGAPESVRQVDLVSAYLDHLRPVFPDASGLGPFALAVDCANGATSALAPVLFRQIGLSPVVVGAEPDGRNINLNCGSTNPALLSRTVVDHGCRMGVAFDGDGDRAIFVDHRGQVVDGDAVLLMCARRLQKEGKLDGGAVAATVMSNVGLELALRAHGIGLVRCQVGDRYVRETMRDYGLVLGGEQSGHIIFADYLFTGDGLCTALNVLRTVAAAGRPLADLAADLLTYPQVLLNVRVGSKVDWRGVPAVAAAVARAESRVAGRGRVLVRYSGTEPLLRVMIEGEEEGEIRTLANDIVTAAREHLS
jgi:phosphoglucosamine mutase